MTGIGRMTAVAEALHERVGGRIRHRGDKVEICCPCHEDRTASAAIGVTAEGKLWGKCQACGADVVDILATLGISGADLWSLVYGDRVEIVTSPMRRRSVPAVVAFQQSWREWVWRAHQSLMALSTADHVWLYLADRGVTRDDALRLHRGFTNEPPPRREDFEDERYLAGRLLIPQLSKSGTLVSVQGRAIDDDGPKYLSSRGACRAGWSRGDWDATPLAIIVEGPLDAVPLARLGLPHVVVKGGNVHLDDIVALRSIPRLLIATDPDEGGRGHAARMLEQLDHADAMVARGGLCRDGAVHDLGDLAQVHDLVELAALVREALSVPTSEGVYDFIGDVIAVAPARAPAAVTAQMIPSAGDRRRVAAIRLHHTEDECDADGCRASSMLIVEADGSGWCDRHAATRQAVA